MRALRKISDWQRQATFGPKAGLGLRPVDQIQSKLGNSRRHPCLIGPVSQYRVGAKLGLEIFDEHD